MVKCASFWGHGGKALADFYAAALDWEVTQTFGETAAMISDGTTTYVFFTAESFKAPNWPVDELVFHLDLTFSGLEAAEQRLLSLGATKPAHQPGGKHWTALLDPSGQPLFISAADKNR